MSKKNIDIIIPVHNEEENIPLMYHALIKVFEDLKKQYEFTIIFVNDGSKDNSLNCLRSISKKDKRVRYLSFSRNFGHQAAIEAGLNYSKGDAVIMMDGDLQHPPESISKLLELWEKGFDVVNTKRMDSSELGLFKRVTSKGYYWLINKLSSITIEPGSADFRLLDSKVVEVINRMPEKDKFFRGLVNWVGFDCTVLDYKQESRKFGSPSYSLKKMLNLALIGITSFSMLPMKLIIILGAILTFLGLISSFVMGFVYLSGSDLFSGTAILASFIVMNTGLITLVTGINSIYLITMLKQIKGRPNYIISESNLELK